MIRPLLATVLLCIGLVATAPAARAQYGSALRFDGADDVVIVPDAPEIQLPPNSTFTLELWIKVTEIKSVYHMLGKRPVCGSNPSGFYQVARDPSGWGFGTAVCAAGAGGPGGDPALNVWTHFAVSHDSGSMKAYLNGALVTSNSCALNAVNTAELKFGGSSTCDHFKGLLDEIRLWNVVRTPGEIAANYRSPVAPSTPGLIAYWNFDEATADQHAYDITGHGHDGTLGSSLAAEPNDPVREPSDLFVGVEPAGGGMAASRVEIVPNPLSRAGSIRFWSDRAGLVGLRVHDVAGRLVREETRWLGSGSQVIALEARDGAGRKLTPGLYLVRVFDARSARVGRFAVIE